MIERGRFLCRAHWFALPKPLRDAIWATWRAYQQALAEGRRDAFEVWRRNTEEALRYLAERFPPAPEGHAQ